jgi:hypothetical protein
VRNLRGQVCPADADAKDGRAAVVGENSTPAMTTTTTTTTTTTPVSELLLALWLLRDRLDASSHFRPYHATLPAPPSRDRAAAAAATPTAAAAAAPTVRPDERPLVGSDNSAAGRGGGGGGAVEGSLLLPVQWGEEVLGLLGGSPLHGDLTAQREAAARDWRAVCLVRRL